jgi:hypothetical protein
VSLELSSSFDIRNSNFRASARRYRFFFPFDFLEPVGITLATVLTIELAIFATTPFLAVRFFAPVVFDLAFAPLLVFVFDLVVAAFFAINDSPMRSPFSRMVSKI